MNKPASTLILAAALLIGAGPYVVSAARNAADPNTRAQVDLQQVFDASDARNTADAKTGQFARKLDQKFTEMAQMQFLTPSELRDLSLILVKEAPTPEETAKAAQLKTESEKRNGELNTLGQKKEADLTAADRNRLRELNGMRPVHAQTMVKIQQLYQQMVNEENGRNERAGMAAVREIVKKIAKDKGITEVFDTSTMIVAPVDLTKDALEKVKKKP